MDVRTTEDRAVLEALCVSLHHFIEKKNVLVRVQSVGVNIGAPADARAFYVYIQSKNMPDVPPDFRWAGMPLVVRYVGKVSLC